jgi:hypothetical protein
MRRILSTAVLLATTFGVAFTGSYAGAGSLISAAPQQKTDATEVKIDNFSFGPAELKVKQEVSKVVLQAVRSPVQENRKKTTVK